MPTITTPLMNKQSSSKDGSCRLAIRLLDGTQLIHEFDGRESLSAVRVYVITQKSVEGESKSDYAYEENASQISQF